MHIYSYLEALSSARTLATPQPATRKPTTRPPLLHRLLLLQRRQIFNQIDQFRSAHDAL